MKDNDDFRPYLIGELSEPAQQRIEERLMTEPDHLRELLVVEDEIVDDHLAGRLSESEEARFSTHFLCTEERREKLRFGSALRRYISAAESKATPSFRPHEKRSLWPRLSDVLVPLPAPWRFATAAGVSLLILVGVWAFVRVSGLQDQADQISVELRTRAQELIRQLDESRARSAEMAGQLRRERDRVAELEQALESVRSERQASTPTPPGTVSVVLSAGLLRSAGSTQRITIPPSSATVRMLLATDPNGYSAYRATLHEVEGDEVLTMSKLEGERVDDQWAVALTLPTEILPHGDYYLSLSGMTGDGALEPLGRYVFRVVVE